MAATLGRGEFARRVLIALLLAGLALLAVELASVLLLVFAAVVFAALLRLIADPLCARLGLGAGLATLAAVTIVALVVGGAAWLFGSQLAAQFGDVGARLPGGLAALRGWLERLPFGDRLEGLTQFAPGGGEVIGRIVNASTSAVGVITNAVIVIVGGVFLASGAQRYAGGLIRLFPPADRPPAGRAFDAAGRSLRKFLKGQLATMAIDGVLAGLGLWAVGAPAPLALGLLLAVVNFIPFFGPLIGAIPGILIALTVGPTTALYAALVYLAVQQAEGNLISPLIQDRLVSIPPALLIFAVLGFSVLFGPLGAVVAAPLTVVLYTLVVVLWEQEALDEPVPTPGADEGPGQRPTARRATAPA